MVGDFHDILTALTKPPTKGGGHNGAGSFSRPPSPDEEEEEEEEVEEEERERAAVNSSHFHTPLTARKRRPGLTRLLGLGEEERAGWLVGVVAGNHGFLGGGWLEAGGRRQFPAGRWLEASAT